MKKLLLTTMLLTSISCLALLKAPVVPTGVSGTPAGAVVANHQFSALISGILAKINVTSPESVRLKDLEAAVTSLHNDVLAKIPNLKDLAPSVKSELTEVCNKMAQEAQALMALNTAGDWFTFVPDFVKKPKTSVLKLRELLRDIYAADELINGKTVSTIFKQYVYRPVVNNKLKTFTYVALLLAANKAGVLDLGYTVGKGACKFGLNAGHWLLFADKYNLPGAIEKLVAGNKVAPKVVQPWYVKYFKKA
jgi:hypothetical protein